ncbi:Transcription initiation factor IIB [Thermogladius calderae 1633]|uniref:Transcription initiation factor IIB n=1 Tax=Thermogladius calderae (strain DSM 22663 / VKM B-2946 / 1633) TaxID=1184251 RepID=I3TCJ7_THEC1|nr:transcription initiation factor IIB family protein [Thermogladius calderae]AFK50485.1 Transcription initiation factor IIB [Thermogladius calderae 1633]
MKIETAVLRCPVCGNQNIVFDYSENAYVCPVCGTVLEERPIDYGIETLIKDETTPRVSGSFTNRVHDRGIGGTEIAGRIVNHVKEGRGWVARQKDVRVSKSERIVEKALKHLNDLVKLIKPPTAVAETAGEILREAVAGKNFKEKTLKRLAAASLYLSYKIHGYPRPFKQFASELGLEPQEVWNAIKMVSESVKNLNKKLARNEPQTIISYIVKSSGLPPEVEFVANKIVAEVTSTGLVSGKGLSSLAASAVYVAAILTGNRRTQLDIAKTVGLTDVAIRNSYSEIVRNLDIVITM